MIDGFLLGVIATASIASALFFLKFWRRTRDFLFLTFALAFFVEGFIRCARLLSVMPDEGNPRIYVVRLLTFLLILGAIIHKNRSA